MNHIATSSNIKTEKKSLSSKQRLLSLYYEPPQIELTLDEFEMLSLDRLQLLRGIEVLKAKGDEAAFNTKVNALESKYMTNKKDSRLSDVQRDQISHFILRLAYCRTEDLRRWFLIQECALLKYRLDYLDDQQREQFMSENQLHFDIVSDREKERLRDKLTGLAGVLDQTTFVRTTYYRIPFVQALSLIGGRQVYLQDGFAYVPLQRLVSIIVTRFRMHLSRALVEAANNFDYVGSDTRIGPLLKNMNKQFIGNDFSSANKSQALDKLSPEKIDMAAEINMPLCMKNLHVNLKKEHKLKHWGRLQYGLFLKGAGLDMDGAQQFWESHFTKIMTHDQYMKSYAYNVRHMYGKEGARKNYTPYSCMKIIMGAPPEAGGHHGCPYRHASDSQLGLMLSQMKIGSEASREILNLAKTSNYQLACQKHFDVTHPDFHKLDLKMGDTFASHPNLWFQASVSYHKAKNGQPVNSTSSGTSSSAASGADNSSSSSSSGSSGGDENTSGAAAAAAADVVMSEE